MCPTKKLSSSEITTTCNLLNLIPSVTLSLNHRPESPSGTSVPACNREPCLNHGEHGACDSYYLPAVSQRVGYSHLCAWTANRTLTSFPSFLFTIMGGVAAFHESSGPHSTSINYHGRATPALGPCLENFGRNCTYINELVVEHA